MFTLVNFFRKGKRAAEFYICNRFSFEGFCFKTKLFSSQPKYKDEMNLSSSSQQARTGVCRDGLRCMKGSSRLFTMN